MTDDPWDRDEPDDNDGPDTLPCPACGADIYDDSERCPVCGEYVVMRTGSGPRRTWWWIALGLALLAMLLFVLVRWAL